MATRKKASRGRKQKTVDVPPKGKRNRDPITGAPGSHPVETGAGAMLGGAAAGLAVGALGGPVGAVIGSTIGGAVVGGLAGKGVGELVDPTREIAVGGKRKNRARSTTHRGRTKAVARNGRAGAGRQRARSAR